MGNHLRESESGIQTESESGDCSVKSFSLVILTIVPGLISPPRSNIGAWAITLEKVKVIMKVKVIIFV